MAETITDPASVKTMGEHHPTAQFLAHLEEHGTNVTEIEKGEGVFEVDEFDPDALETFGAPIDEYRMVQIIEPSFGIKRPQQAAINEEVESPEEHAVKLSVQEERMKAIFVRDAAGEGTLILTNGLHRKELFIEHGSRARIVVKEGTWFDAITELIQANDGKTELSHVRRFIWFNVLWEKTAPPEIAQKMRADEAFGLFLGELEPKEGKDGCTEDEVEQARQWVRRVALACDKMDTDMQQGESPDEYDDRRVHSWAKNQYGFMSVFAKIDPNIVHLVRDYVPASAKVRSPEHSTPSIEAGYLTTDDLRVIAEYLPNDLPGTDPELQEVRQWHVVNRILSHRFDAQKRQAIVLAQYLAHTEVDDPHILDRVLSIPPQDLYTRFAQRNRRTRRAPLPDYLQPELDQQPTGEIAGSSTLSDNGDGQSEPRGPSGGRSHDVAEGKRRARRGVAKVNQSRNLLRGFRIGIIEELPTDEALALLESVRAIEERAGEIGAAVRQLTADNGIFIGYQSGSELAETVAGLSEVIGPENRKEFYLSFASGMLRPSGSPLPLPDLQPDEAAEIVDELLARAPDEPNLTYTWALTRARSYASET